MDGIVIIDKPGGITSHDLVLFVRRRFHLKKVGHAGTLDPIATGVLVLLLGRATKLASRFICDDKEYIGTLRLGVRTHTGDSEGRVISTEETSGITTRDIVSAFASFGGTIEQTPPMYSALRHKGKRLYQLARKGIEVERKPRTVTLHDIKVNKIDMPEIQFSICCTKGTYIRKIACDVGDKLGCGAHLIGLRRTKSGKFSIKDAVSYEELKEFDEERLAGHVLEACP